MNKLEDLGDQTYRQILENNMINPHEEKCAQEKFYGRMTEYAKHFQNFEEIGIVYSITTRTAKI